MECSKKRIGNPPNPTLTPHNLQITIYFETMSPFR